MIAILNKSIYYKEYFIMKKIIIYYILSLILLADSSRIEGVQVKGYFPSYDDFPAFDIKNKHRTIWDKSRHIGIKEKKKFLRETNSISRKKISKNRGFVIISEDRKRKKMYLKYINKIRSKSQYCGKYGLFHATTPVKWSDRLYESAKEHSLDMAINQSFSHKGSGKNSDRSGISQGTNSTPSTRASYHRYRGGIVGENIALGYGKDNSSIQSAIRSWLNSDSHCANLMSPQYRNMGMSLVENKISKNKSHFYWSQELGT